MTQGSPSGAPGDPPAAATAAALGAEVLAIVERHVTRAWLEETGTALDAETRFSELAFDAVDQAIVMLRVEEALAVRIGATLPWFDRVQELIDHVVAERAGCDQRETIASFFRTTWAPAGTPYRLSGDALVEAVNALAPARVLDVGCGGSPFRGRIRNLVGIDLVNPRADVVGDILDYPGPPGGFDAIICLGSINFGGRRDILSQLRKLRALLAPGGRIYMRVNPGVPWPDRPALTIFPWSRRNIPTIGAEAGLRIQGAIEDDPSEHGPRLYFVYVADDAGGARPT